MGPTPTLPPYQPHPGRDRRSRRPGPEEDLVLGVDGDQPPTHDHDRTGDLEDQEARVRQHHQLLGDLQEANRAGERPVVAGEPAGRRLPVPLNGHEGVER